MATDDALRDALENGELVLSGRLLDASNAAYLGHVDGIACVYKPRSGERELWDFPSGTLAHREVAAFKLAERIGLDIVPTTVWRDDGPAGPGMCQRWIEHSESAPPVDVVPVGTSPNDWRVVMTGAAPDGSEVELSHADTSALRDIALFDAIVNNADRKAGHLLVDLAGKLWCIDHGISFHPDPKLRTVLWGFAGSPFDARHVSMLDALTEVEFLSAHLDEVELLSLQDRIAHLRRTGSFPFPSNDWPPLPWPLF